MHSESGKYRIILIRCDRLAFIFGVKHIFLWRFVCTRDMKGNGFIRDMSTSFATKPDMSVKEKACELLIFDFYFFAFIPLHYCLLHLRIEECSNWL